MKQYIIIIQSFLNQGWVGSLIGLIGVIVTIFVFYFSKNETMPNYRVHPISYISQKN